MVIGRIKFLVSTVQPKPEEIDYWIDILADPYGSVIRTWNGFEWKRIDQFAVDAIEGFQDTIEIVQQTLKQHQNEIAQILEDTNNIHIELDTHTNLITVQREDFEQHKADNNNPHSVTKEQVGLGNADNTADIDKPISTATQAALNTIQGYIDMVSDELTAHKNDKENPHKVTKAQVGLGNCDNTSDLNKPVSTATQAAIDLVSDDLQNHEQDINNPHSVNKSQVGLGNLTNDIQVKRNEMGVANGVATLNEQGLIPTSQLPSYVDDVIDCYATYTKAEDGTLSNIKLYSDEQHQQAITGESGKIYVDITDSATSSAYQFRWTGTQFAVVGAPTVIGEVTGTAFDGKRGKSLEDKTNAHISNTSNPHNVTKAQIGLGNVDNTSDINKPISIATQDALDDKQNILVSGTNIKTVNGQSLLGEGDITITAVGGVGEIDPDSDGTGIRFGNDVHAIGSYSRASGNTVYAWGDHSFVDGTGDKTPSEQSGYPKVYPDSTLEEFKDLYERGLRPQIAKGEYSHISGKHNLAYGDFSIVHGSYNKDYGYSNYLFGVGIRAWEFYRNCMFVGASREDITADDYDKVTGTDVEGDVASSCLFIGNAKEGAADDSPKLSGSIIVSPAEIFGYTGTYSFRGSICNSIILNNSGGVDSVNALNSILIDCYNNEQRTDCICISDTIVLDGQRLRCTSTVYPNNAGIGFGYNVTISDNSIGMDSQINSSTTATMGSIAIGSNNNAKSWSAAFGANNIAKNQTTFCAGDSNIAYTIHSIAMGIQSVSLGDYSVAIGGGGLKLSENLIDTIMDTEDPGNELIEHYFTAYYSNTDSYHIAYGKGSMVTGKNNIALGNYSSAHGEGNVAQSDHQFVVGKFGQFKENIAFAVGWGTYYGNRLNAFEVLNDGNANLKGTLSQSSDIRLKQNVKDLESKGSLRLVEFDWKNANGHSYGFIADEVEKIYPDMVSKDSSGYKVLNYNAAICAKLAELESIIKQQQKLINKLEKQIQL